MIKNLSFPFSIFTLILINILDRGYSTVVSTLLIYVLGFLFSLRVEKKHKIDSANIFFIIYSIYLISAYIFSLSFHNDNNFIVKDSIKYIQQFSINWKWDLAYYKEYFHNCYFELADNNALYNTYVRFLASISNNIFGGASILYATLGQTFFGIISATVLYRILLMYFQSAKAFKYTLVFALFSLFHFYSSVIIRDIVIAFFYLLVLEIILKKFSYKNLIKLLILLLIVWGIRLYSGVFIIVFILFYIYIPIKNSRYKRIIIPFFVLIIVIIFISSSILIQQSIDEITLYQEYSIERGEMSGGLSNYLINLPPVIKQIVLTLYSQFHPFPPYAPFLAASTISQYYMSTVVLLYSIWWAFIFYPLLIFLFLKGTFKKIPFKFRMLFLISILFIAANTAHIDVRRMMPVYPTLYLVYLIVVNNYIPRNFIVNTNRFMIFTVFIALAAYLFLIA